MNDPGAPFGYVEVCPTCLCLDVEWEDWIDVKTGQPTGNGTGSDSIFCHGCERASDDGLGRYTERLPRGTPGVWEMPPLEWFGSDDEWADQVCRLRAFGVEAAERRAA